MNLTDVALQNAATDALTLLQMQADNADTIHVSSRLHPCKRGVC